LWRHPHNEVDGPLFPWRERPLGGKGERTVHNTEQYTACGTIALECEAFLAGTLADYWDDEDVDVPVWAWLNLLAHGSVRQIGECALRPSWPEGGSRSWRVARSYLAYEVLDLTDLEFTVADMQTAVLIPLELELAAQDDVAGWTPKQWVDEVEHAFRRSLVALEQ
jgi:hypothetical protein